MYKLKFVIEDMKLRARMFTNAVYFDDIDEVTVKMIEAQRVFLLSKSNVSDKSRVFCLIENLKEEK